MSPRITRRAAFTLVELLLVTSIMAVLLGIASLVTGNIRANRALDNSLSESLAVFREARAIAISQNGAVLSFTSSFSGPVTYRLTNGAGRVIQTANLPPQVTMRTAPTTLFPITFTSNGVASAGGTVTFDNGNGRSGRIMVTAATGYATMSIP